MPKHLSLDPLPRTLSLLDQSGWVADVVERRERYATYDCFGCWDVLAFDPAGQAMLVQCTSKANILTRVSKCIANPHTKKLLQRRVWCEIWGWDETKPEPRRVHLEWTGGEPVAREGAT
jgi:hypothetical protein